MSSGFGRSLITLVVSFALGCSSSSDAGGGDPPTPEPVASVTVTSDRDRGGPAIPVLPLPHHQACGSAPGGSVS